MYHEQKPGKSKNRLFCSLLRRPSRRTLKPLANAPDSLLPCREDEFHRLSVEQDAVDHGTKSISEACVSLRIARRVVNVFPFSKADFQVQDVLPSEHGGTPENDFIHAVRNVNEQLFL